MIVLRPRSMDWAPYHQWLVALVLVLSIASAHSNSKLIRATRGATVFKGSYFVHMKDSVPVAEVHSFVQRLVGIEESGLEPGFHISVKGIIEEAAHGFSTKMSKVALSKVLESRLVETVEEDYFLKAGSVCTTTSWGLDRLDQESLAYDSCFNPPCNLTGNGVDVYVLDSGIHYSHVEFGGRVEYVGCDPVDLIHGSNRSGQDCTGHGTHVASIAAGQSMGVAPEATLVSIRVLSCDNMGTVSAVVHGIECVLKSVKQRKRPAIVNLSLYGQKNRAFKRAVDTLLRKGLTVVSIAGNDEVQAKDACKLNPASVHGVITVAASTKDDLAFHLSNAGACVDLYAPGDNIPSADSNCDSCYSTLKGTSLAAPHVTGALALLLQKCPTMAPWKTRQVLLSQLVIADKLDYTLMPGKFHALTPNLLLHTSSLQCDLQC